MAEIKQFKKPDDAVEATPGIKVVRVFFDVEGTKYCVDRPYNPEKNDQENGNDVVNSFVDSMSKSTIVPALLVDGDQGHPVFLNLGLLPVVAIANVGVYVLKEQK